MIRTLFAAGALALTLGTAGSFATATPAAADTVTIVRHEGPGWRHDRWRDGPRWHRPPARCRTVVRERMTRHGPVVERTRVCRR